MKKTYLTLIQIAGLRRADAARAREPIGEGEVIALPDGFARTLLDSGSIEPTDAEETVELFWDQPVELIKSNDPEGLKNALVNLGFDFASGPDQSVVSVTGIAPTDVQALAQALEAQGALVLLSGEQLAGLDHARLTVLLPQLGGEALLAEIARRCEAREIAATDLPEEVLALAWSLFADGLTRAPAGEEASESAEGEGEVPPLPPAPTAPAEAKKDKSPRKRG